MNKHIICFGIVLTVLLTSGCLITPEVHVVELGKNMVSYDEKVRINNCGGKADSEQMVSREFATTVEFGAGVAADYPSIVQGNLSVKYSEYRNTYKRQRLVAPPGTNMEFVLRWHEDVRAGNVQVNGKSGTYEVRIPVSVEQISSRDLGCGISSQQSPPSNLSLSTPSTQSMQTTQPVQAQSSPTTQAPPLPSSGLAEGESVSIQATTCSPQIGWTPPKLMDNGEWIYDCLSSSPGNWVGQPEEWKGQNWKRGAGKSEIVQIVVPPGATKMGLGCDPCTVFRPDGTTVSSNCAGSTNCFGPFQPNITITDVKVGEVYKVRIFGGDTCPTRPGAIPPCAPELYIWFNLP